MCPQAKAPWYRGIVDHVSSWGYTVVQYTNGGLFPIVVDRVEVGAEGCVSAALAQRDVRGGDQVVYRELIEPSCETEAGLVEARGGCKATTGVCCRPGIRVEDRGRWGWQKTKTRFRIEIQGLLAGAGAQPSSPAPAYLAFLHTLHAETRKPAPASMATTTAHIPGASADVARDPVRGRQEPPLRPR